MRERQDFCLGPSACLRGLISQVTRPRRGPALVSYLEHRISLLVSYTNPKSWCLIRGGGVRQVLYCKHTSLNNLGVRFPEQSALPEVIGIDFGHSVFLHQGVDPAVTFEAKGAHPPTIPLR